MSDLYRTIVADPPWPQPLTGKRKRERGGPKEKLPYQTMTVEAIGTLPVGQWAAPGCHLWLWTTNSFLEAGFKIMHQWGFTYLAPIHWIKPSGFGNYVIHRSQTVLFGYRERCVFERLRYFPNVLDPKTDPVMHSQKPAAFYELVEQVSGEPRLELFARRKRLGWHAYGDEVFSDISLQEDSNGNTGL